MTLSKHLTRAALLLLLAGCSKTTITAAEPTAEPSLEPTVDTPPEPPTSEPESPPHESDDPIDETPAPIVGFAENTLRQEELRGLVGAALDSGDLDLAVAASISMMETPELSGMRASGMALLAELYYQEDEDDRAVAILTRLIDESPPVGEFHFILGRILGELGRYDDAEVQLRAAMELRPELLQTYMYLGSVLVAAGGADAAEAVYSSYEQALTEMLAVVTDSSQDLSIRLEILDLLSLATPDDRLTAAMAGLLPSDNFTISVGAVRVLGAAGTPAGIPAMEAFAASAEHEDVAAFVQMAIAAIRAREGER